MLVATTLALYWVYGDPGSFTSERMLTPAKVAEKSFCGVPVVSFASQNDTL